MNKRIGILIVIALFAVVHNSDGQQPRSVSQQLQLAGLAPRGALLYLQTRDLGALMRQWLASPVRKTFYESPSYSAFSSSHIFLKLQSRKEDFEKGIGFGLSEERLAELAGGTSAVAIYDVGNLELVFITEVPRERAIATILFKELPKFQERSSPNGVYYVREVTADGGRINQQFCFAYNEGRLIVTTTEGLMIRTLGNAKAAGDDSMLQDVVALAEKARGFSTHEVTLWTDQKLLNENRHFRSYWIHPNPPATGIGSRSPLEARTSEMEAGLMDLRITPQGLTEQRWFSIKPGGWTAANEVPTEQANAILKMVPADAQLVELRKSNSDGSQAVSGIARTLFAEMASGSVEPPDLSHHSDDDDEDGSSGSQDRYSNLDRRFDVDVDDTASVPASASSTPQPSTAVLDSGQRFRESLTRFAAAIGGAGFCELARSKNDPGRPFVRFERAIVIATPATIDRSLLENAVTEELRSRFVVMGMQPSLTWRDEGGIRYVAQSLLDQGAAYSTVPGFVIISTSREFARDIAAGAARPVEPAVTGTVGYYGIVRVASAKPVFDALMNKLDGKSASGAKTDSDEEESIKFFSDNISSLIRSSMIREIRVRRDVDSDLLTERLSYSW